MDLRKCVRLNFSPLVAMLNTIYDPLGFNYDTGKGQYQIHILSLSQIITSLLLIITEQIPLVISTPSTEIKFHC